MFFTFLVIIEYMVNAKISFYQNTIDALNKSKSILNKQISILGWSRLLVFITAAFSVYYCIADFNNLHLFILIGSVIVFLFLLYVNNKLSNERELITNMIKINENEVAVLEHRPSFFDSGNEYLDDESYHADLDIFGDRSLFHLINRTTTIIGKERLAGLFKAPITTSEGIKAQQSAIKELSEKTLLRQHYCAIGMRSTKNQVDYNAIYDWLDSPNEFIGSPKIKFFLILAPLLIIVSVFYGWIADCFRNGIVPAYLRKKMVDTIYWTIKSNVLYKNDLILLDLIASNNFKRPLYFSAPYSVSKSCNVDSYCFQEGWVYKFMPVKADTTEYVQGLGGVDGPGSYDLLMNKCKWGNLNDPKVFVDPESRNNIVRFKQNVLRTAQWMIKNGDVQKAKNLLGLNEKYFPYSKFVPETYDLSYVDLYFQVGDKDKAIALINRMASCYKSDLNYYHSYATQRRGTFQDDIRTSFAVLQQLSMIANRYKETKLGTDIETYLNQKVREFE